jgi:CxxC-x17-CxxC domain-containing protein
LGALLITQLQLAAMSRVDIPEEKRKDFFLYIDEFQNFATESFVNILSEARKYRLALILGHQYITQMEETVRDAVFGNVGTIVVFRVGAEDAEFLEKEFLPEFMAADLVNLGKYNIYLKLMIDGLAGRPFSAETLVPLPRPETSNQEKIIRVSRERYGTPRQEVEEKIARWTGVFEMPQTSPQQATGPVLYDARCSMCGKDTKVVFRPDGKRPVYCKSCRSKLAKTASAQSEASRLPEGKIEVMPFTKPKPQRKEVNLSELRKVLEESLDKAKEPEGKPEDKNQNGVIKPGETVKF